MDQYTKTTQGLTGEELVISGMSGLFPKSDSVLEFKENLYNKVDMVTNENDRFDIDHPEIPKYYGMISGVDRFDAQFFKVNYKQALNLEPMSGKLLESAYSAIFDAGINPLELRGKKVGVFIGAAFSDTEAFSLYSTKQINGLGITGGSKTMYANRISYWLDTVGPSYTLDAACSSSMACLEHAYKSIASGICDAAIIGGSNLCLHPNLSWNMKRYGFLCLDGKTKCFDKHGDGSVRSDAISVFFIQKAKDAKRIYAEIKFAKSSYSSTIQDKFLPIRTPEEIQYFLEKFYAEAGVSPRQVEYVEASAPGIAEADGNELEAIGKVFAKDKHIHVGCVKSNMGNSEPASGGCSLTKICLAYQCGQIPANLHYNEPQDNIPAVREGRIHVITENTPFGRGFTALNSFAYTGTNIHALMKGHYKPKNLERYRSSIPHLVLASGRQEQCVENMIKKLNQQSVDPEQIALLHDMHEIPVPGHTTRGYTILETNANNETVCIGKEVKYTDGLSRPVWFVYSGMGSQWPTMGAELMRIPTFAAAVEKCRQALEPKGIDIVDILTNPDKSIYNNILHSFVGIAAVQIGLTDVLRELGIVPDNIIGHSVGELGCAYADGCFTAEEMILSAYSRGLVSLQTELIKGSMAAVGLGFKTVRDMCPPEIQVACHNSSESSTISGPADIMKSFVAELTERGVFAREVPCSNIAFHSKYIQNAGPSLLKYLREIIKSPKKRSEKWISTSVPQNQWNNDEAQYSSAEYHTNNLLNPVLFEESSRLIPENAIVIEVAPHGLLQAILTRSLAACVHIPLTRRGYEHPVKFLLEAVGKMYLAGLTPKVKSLYPKVEYPVSTETPLLSHLVEWEHSEEWLKTRYSTKTRVVTAGRDFILSTQDDDYKYFEYYKRDGVCVFPEAALLTLVWETYAMYRQSDYRTMSVEFTNVYFYEEVEINDLLKLGVMIFKGNHCFEIHRGKTAVATGFIKELDLLNDEERLIIKRNDESNILLSSQDIYQILRMRGYSYEDKFQSIQSATSDFSTANIKYTDEWIPLLDSLLQFDVIKRKHDGLSKLNQIDKLTINVEKHARAKHINLDGLTCLRAEYYDIHGITSCGGIEIDGTMYNDKLIIETDPDILHTRCFVPHLLQDVVDLKSALHVNMQVVADNTIQNKIKIINKSSTDYPDIYDVLKEVTDEIPHKEYILNGSVEDVDDACPVVIVDNLLEDGRKMETISTFIPTSDSFILSIESESAEILPTYELFNIITVIHSKDYLVTLVLMTLKSTNVKESITYLPIGNDNILTYLPGVLAEIQKPGKVVLVSEWKSHAGLISLVKKLRKDYGEKISLILVDYNVEHFDKECKLFKEQIQKKLSINILNKGYWGGFYSLPNIKTANVRNISLTSTQPGNLDGLKWIEIPQIPESNSLVEVSYAGISNEDAENAAGISHNETKGFGKEFSGINVNGERVMGLVPEGAMGSVVRADPSLLWPVPKQWSLEDAATVPLAYVNAYYCLDMILNLQIFKMNAVFINGAAEPFGQAIISLLLHLGYTIYANVENAAQKSLLLLMYPQLNEENIFWSRTDSHCMVIRNSKSTGCSIVINCASGELRNSAMKCVDGEGYILDICEDDMKSNKDFGMYFLMKAKSYKAVRPSSIFKPEYAAEKKKIQHMLAQGIAKGIVRPLNRVVYSPTDVSKAFRLQSLKRFSGKILIKIGQSQALGEINATPSLNYSSEGTYIVVCNESTFGVEVADRLVKRGARKLLLHMEQSASKVLDGYCHLKIESWKKLKVSVNFASEKLSSDKECVYILKEGTKMGPVLGIFIVQNFNNKDKDVTMEEPEHMMKEFNDSVQVVSNLDVSSRAICNNLKHFVVLNHSPKSTSDAYAVAATERICEARNEAGLPALAFHCLAISEFVQTVDDGKKARPQKLSTVMNALETSLKLNYKNVLTFDLKKRNSCDFLQNVAKIIGLKDINNINEDIMLSDLNLNDAILHEIKLLIENVYGLKFSTKDVAQLDIKSLSSIGYINKRTQNTNFDAGLGAFYTFTDEDECMATEPVVQMPTKLSNCSEEEIELDLGDTYLMMIPGFEGHHQIYTQISERLKVKAMTFQLGPDMTDDSIQNMAYNILKFVQTVDDGKKARPQKLSTVMNALETSLKLNYKNVLTFDLKKRNSCDFLQNVAKIIGLKDINNINEDIMLSDLNLNDAILHEIKLLIENVYGLKFSTKDVAQLDIKSLSSIGYINKRTQNTNFDAGLGAFYTFTDEDECMATEPVVQMPTKLSNCSEEEIELDLGDTYLMMIPGFEGHHQIYTQISERLKVKAMTFQLGPDMTDDSIQNMAYNILKFMKKKFQPKSNFYILGYSFGINVALELAGLLEKEGCLGTVYCLDSSPDALRVQLDAYLGPLTDNQLQNSIVEHMYRLMTGTDSEELKNDLKNLDSWSEKVIVCVNRLRGLAKYSNQYKTSILQAAYRRIMEAKHYEPNFKLQSELVLIKGIPHPKAKPLPEDYNLSKYTTKPVKVIQIESDHATAPYDSRVSNIVNKFLDSDLLSKFEKEVLCDSYLVESVPVA
uniref:Ketosynthase family 3 (KS3) domain-containing protein n=1 Tax=Heliothis virescens TaxID=7102 RepID=A0A2A4JTZ4_HELVI